MTRAFTSAILTVLFSGAVFGQASANVSNNPAAGARFEVASVKPVLNWPPPTDIAGERGPAGGGCPTSMKVEPSRVDFKCTTLAMLIGYAFRVSPERVTGPAWMMAIGAPRFNIEGNIPQGASKNQVPEMFQNLLADRFKLVIHRQTANLPVYALVLAKGGLCADSARNAARRGGESGIQMSARSRAGRCALEIKKAALQESAGSPPVDSDAPSNFDAFYGTVQSRTIPGADGSDSVTIISNPRMGTVRQTGDPYRGQRWEAPNISFAGLADLLDNVAPFLSLPVIDMTGRDGRYNLTLEVSLEDLRRHAGLAGEPAGPGNAGDMEEIVLSAINNGLLKLGLRLEHRKGPLETVVVDRVEKTPTEN
jgi:uncharacterized protein (TIGR03435 family)